jgi:hypothetical protein
VADTGVPRKASAQHNINMICRVTQECRCTPLHSQAAHTPSFRTCTHGSTHLPGGPGVGPAASSACSMDTHCCGSAWMYATKLLDECWCLAAALVVSPPHQMTCTGSPITCMVIECRPKQCTAVLYLHTGITNWCSTKPLVMAYEQRNSLCQTS